VQRHTLQVAQPQPGLLQEQQTAGGGVQHTYKYTGRTRRVRGKRTRCCVKCVQRFQELLSHAAAKLGCSTDEVGWNWLELGMLGC
jgi:hypothetical protein